MLHFKENLGRYVWTVFTSHIHKRTKYCVTLYCPLISGTANDISPGENFGIEGTPLWELMKGTWRPKIGWCYVTPRISDRFFKRFHEWKCNITVISLLWGKYTRTFVPRFPGIPEMLYFPPPSASGNINISEIPGNLGTNIPICFPQSNEITV